MKIIEKVSLKQYTTFQIGGPAKYFGVVRNEEDLQEAFSFAKSRKLPFFVLGGGSNLLISDHGFSGLVIKNEIKGIKFKDQGEETVILEIGAGEILDEVVVLSVARNLFGLENLSGIPGTVGGAVVQNAGAYGREIKDCLFSVEGLNFSNGKKFIFKNSDCQYGYRDSIFKKNKKFIITAVVFKLNKNFIPNLDYAGLKNKLINEKNLTLQKIREAVLNVRAEKLPDWHKIGTVGSFFKNPIITEDKYNDLKIKFPNLQCFPVVKGKVKVSLAWILDNICGLKGYQEGNVGLYEKQPIVVVNLGQAIAKEIINFTEKIKKIVFEKTGIKIEEEVEII